MHVKLPTQGKLQESLILVSQVEADKITASLKHSPIQSLIKAAMVSLAIHGLLPY